MTNEQLYLAIGIPLALNTLLYVAFSVQVNTPLDDLRSDVDKRFDDLRAYIDARFDNLRTLHDASHIPP